MLRQQKAQRCHAEEQADFGKYKTDIEGLFQGEEFTLDEGSGYIQLPSFVSQGARFLPEVCPAAERVVLRIGGGRAFEFSYEPLCYAASSLSGLFVAVATVIAALYVGRSVGGQ
ncbi:MAG TPA: hypothetical protein DC050_08635 [Pseudomonas sp.]|nr:hypothetical protein [Pseudomonas sp.]